MNGIDISDLIPEFLSECKEHLATLEQGLLAFEIAGEEQRKTAINAMFRAAHTIKGSSRVMGFQHVHNVAHAMEDVLGELREGRRTADSALIDGLLAAVDTVRDLVAKGPAASQGVEEAVKLLRRLLAASTPAAAEPPPPVAAPPAFRPGGPGEGASSAAPPAKGRSVDDLFENLGLPPQGKPAPAQAPPPPPQPPAPAAPPAPPAVEHAPSGTAPAPAASAQDETVRLSVSRLDDLLQRSGELMMGIQQAEDLDKRTRGLLSTITLSLRPLLARAGEDRAEWKALLSRIEIFAIEHADGVRILASVADRIEQEIMSLRLHPVSTLFAPLPRLVRDLAKEHGKDVTLVIEGEGTELDRRILQGLNEPLVHVVRNALDHGLETPEKRVAAGKPAGARLTVRAFRRGGNVGIEIGDDGRGLSPQMLRDTAVKKRLLTLEQAAAMDDLSALELIYLPGFSTSPFITATSGRGVGMDAVKAALAKLGGTLEIGTEMGKGTRFTFILPLTLTVARVLIVEVGSFSYAFPTGSIERLVRLLPENVRSSQGREQLLVDNAPVPLYRLEKVLDPEAPEKEAAVREEGEVVIEPVLLFATSLQRYAFAVTRVVDEREAVLKPLGDLLSGGALATGATLLADGTIALVLDPAACARAARGGPRRIAAAKEDRRGRRILVCDDSPTTRELERSILAAAGHEVDTAFDGAEGWRKVQEGSYELVVTDVEMPNMTGFELTRTIRNDPRFNQLPVVIITTLDRDTERRKGLEAGAQAYLVKNSFDQSELLDTIERLLP